MEISDHSPQRVGVERGVRIRPSSDDLGGEFEPGESLGREASGAYRRYLREPSEWRPEHISIGTSPPTPLPHTGSCSETPGYLSVFVAGKIPSGTRVQTLWHAESY
ncbi:hypothetical protein EYF80_038754 [Liparis tanakae]|uniref:Uncharacterized protein n=1 Tax=Liparis tanakae TaxID=230148 RepID=A0A4Z2GE78_9TELE|nr:hypothetical protein EYF80_038754 [Liparis tanakae]